MGPGNREATDAFRTGLAKAWLHALRRQPERQKPDLEEVPALVCHLDTDSPHSTPISESAPPRLTQVRSPVR
ncbi:MAG: hypothetical protein RQM92_04665 [Candidatus Syntrophopropionicum ammoniitolerans]